MITASPFRRQRAKRGFVLILVLGILILITLLVVGFLGHAMSQIKSVTSYRAQTDSLLLGDVAVNLVKAQIDDATSQATSIWAGLHGFASLRQAIPAFPWPAAPDYVERLIQAHIVGAASQLRPPGSSARGSSGR